MDVRGSYDRAARAYAEHLCDELDRKPLDRHLLNRFCRRRVSEPALLPARPIRLTR
jgi:hypothetical protein